MVRSTRQTVTLADRFGHWGLEALSGLFCALPERASLALGAVVGQFAGEGLKLRARVADENLAAAFPDMAPPARAAILRRMYRHFGEALALFARFPVLEPADLDRWVALEGEPHLAAAMAAGRGVMLVSGHLGHWEILAAALAVRGYPLSLLVGPQRNRPVQEMFTRIRARHGVEVLVAGTDMRGVFRALSERRVVATVGDQDAGPHGYFVDFFGRPASTALGPFRIARRAGAPLLIGYGLKRGGRYVAYGEPPLWPDADVPPDLEARAWSRRYHAVLERLIREYPEQWFWVHRRWKSRPPPDPDRDRETADRELQAPPAPHHPPETAPLPR